MNAAPAAVERHPHLGAGQLRDRLDGRGLGRAHVRGREQPERAALVGVVRERPPKSPEAAPGDEADQRVYAIRRCAFRSQLVAKVGLARTNQQRGRGQGRERSRWRFGIAMDGEEDLGWRGDCVCPIGFDTALEPFDEFVDDRGLSSDALLAAQVAEQAPHLFGQEVRQAVRCVSLSERMLLRADTDDRFQAFAQSGGQKLVVEALSHGGQAYSRAGRSTASHSSPGARAAAV